MRRDTIKIFVALFILVGLLYGCGGGGVGTADVPPGVNPSVPAYVRLDLSSYVAQTNSSVALYARVLDGNGYPVPNVEVHFTNLSSIGAISSLYEGKYSQLKSTTTAYTDANGIARTTIFSSSSGWATLLAQVNVGMGFVRDRKVLYFSSSNTAPSLAPSISLDVSCYTIIGSCSGDPYVVFESSDDNRVAITATVYDEYGQTVANAPLSWQTSHATEVTFDRRDSVTNTSGQGMALVTINASLLRSVETYVNIMVSSSITNRNGIAISPLGIVSLLLNPVTVSTTDSYLTANPTSVNTLGTSTVTANVYSSSGNPAPSGVPVDFSTTCGSLDPLSNTTTNGKATTTFTAPQTIPTGGKCTVTAKVAGTSIGTVDITITQPLTVQPASMTLDETQTGTFTIYGGVAPYTVASRHSHVAVAPATVTASGGTFTATPDGGFCTPVAPAVTCSGTATIEVRDSAGTTVTVTLTVNGT